MPFPSRGAAAPAPSAPAAPQAPMAPPAPAAPAAPMAPPAPTAPGINLWVFSGGQSVLMTEAQARTLPLTTAAMSEDQKSGWSTIAALLPAAAAAAAPAPTGVAPGSRSAFARPAAPAPAPAPAAGAPVALFSGVEGAKVTRKGANLEEGDYIAKVCQAEYKPSRAGKNYIIIEVEIITSSYDAQDPKLQGCNHEGSRATIFINHNDSFANNMKEVMLAVSGFDAQGKARPETDVVTPDECTALISPEQPYAGALVYLEARAIKTRAGGDFTRISWWPCPQHADGTPDTDKLMRDVR